MSWYLLVDPEVTENICATFPIQIRKITVQICGNFWVTQYIKLDCGIGWSLDLDRDPKADLKKLRIKLGLVIR